MVQSLEPYELDAVIQSARKVKSKYGNDFCWKTVMMIAYTGMHREVIMLPEKHKVKIKEYRGKRIKVNRGSDLLDGVYVEWNRPKKIGRAAFTRVRLKKEVVMWAEEYFQRPRARYGRYYNQLMERVYRQFKKDFPDIAKNIDPLIPMTFRYTACHLHFLMGFEQGDVKRIMNVSDKVLEESYSKLKQRQMDNKYREKGW